MSTLRTPLFRTLPSPARAVFCFCACMYSADALRVLFDERARQARGGSRHSVAAHIGNAKVAGGGSTRCTVHCLLWRNNPSPRSPSTPTHPRSARLHETERGAKCDIKGEELKIRYARTPSLCSSPPSLLVVRQAPLAPGPKFQHGVLPSQSLTSRPSAIYAPQVRSFRYHISLLLTKPFFLPACKSSAACSRSRQAFLSLARGRCVFLTRG